MLKNNIDKEILNNLSFLGKGQKSVVLSYVKSLVKKKKKDSKSILKFSGAFNKTDLRQMEVAIQEGCENIDRNKW